MRKLIISEHISLDGFAAGTKGEMDWVKLDDEMFDLVKKFTDEADTALYGRITYQIMDAYWPGAADKPNATRHDIEHSTWYNKVEKIVISRTMQNKNIAKTRFIADNLSDEIKKLKEQPGKNILIFGSPGAAHILMDHNLIDEFWLFVNPVILGNGIPLFAGITNRIKLKLLETKEFMCGVIALHYSVIR